jgi:hypothetical protein
MVATLAMKSFLGPQSNRVSFIRLQLICDRNKINYFVTPRSATFISTVPSLHFNLSQLLFFRLYIKAT